MKATYQHTFNGNHGIEYTTDKGKKGFIHGILDADTARTLAAGPEAIALLRTVTQYEHDPKIGAMIDQFLTNLHAQP